MLRMAEAAASLPALRQNEAEAAAELQHLTINHANLGREEERVAAELAGRQQQLQNNDSDTARAQQLATDASEAAVRLGAEAAEIDEIAASEAALSEEAARAVIDNRTQQGFAAALLAQWQEEGADVAGILGALHAEREHIASTLTKGQRLGPVQGFVIPTLKRCGLLSERVAARYHEILLANFGGHIVGDDVGEFLRYLPDLPEDTAAWVLGELS